MTDGYLNDALKQRLVGAGVLLILAGLLWPILFDFDQRLDLQPPESEIPLMPEVAKVVVEKPKPADADTTAVKTTNAVVNTSTKKSVASAESSTKTSGDKSSGGQAAAGFKALTQSAPKPLPIAGKSTYRIADIARPRLDANGVPLSFVVQVGTFKNWSNAAALKNNLIAQGHKAYSKPSVSSQAGPYRVLVGPLLTYEKAQQVVADIKRNTTIKDAIIKRFGDRQ